MTARVRQLALAKRKRTKGAFSLIETMIASALFFVGLTAIFTTYNTATRLLAHHRHITRAVAIAESNLEELIQRYPGDPALDIGVTPTPRYYDRDALLSASAATYSVTWTVTPFALPGIREITVVVSWYEQGLQQKQFKLRTWRT